MDGFAIADRSSLRALASAWLAAREAGGDAAAARAAAEAAWLRLHPGAQPAEAATPVARMLAIAGAPDPDRSTLGHVVRVFRDGIRQGEPEAQAAERAVAVLQGLHPGTPDEAAYAMVMRMVIVAAERSPRWFWGETAALDTGTR